MIKVSERKIDVSVRLPPKTVKKIDELRGQESRSSFLAVIVLQSIGTE